MLSLDLTFNQCACHHTDNDKTVVTSNQSMDQKRVTDHIAPILQLAMAIGIATQLPTRCNVHFIMEGIDLKNKCLSSKPTINLQDGTQEQSTHECNIHILGLPTVLTGHIVPHLVIASLIGIRLLCKANCTVIFDDKKLGPGPKPII
jgi:hypothetical protein